ncbi:MAG: FG-GAP repeat protein, partial [Saprospiraceae bacterium]|nr:FG-GAP repeat protein [Saprospiraceae bacterium]
MYKNLFLILVLLSILVHQLQAQIWNQLGNDINGTAVENESGKSVSINSMGSMIAIGSPGGEVPGHVRIFENQNSSWTQIGNDITGENDYDKFGEAISISANGSIIAIGAYKNDGNGTDAGHVRIFENQNGSWTQIGNDIDGEASGDESGFSLDLNHDGSVVAIGARNNAGTGNNAGHVRIFENQNGSWTQIGNDIDGVTSGDELGEAVSI